MTDSAHPDHRDCRDAQRSDADRLQTAEEQLRVAQEACGIGVFTLEVATGRMQVSPAFCQLFGLPVSSTLTAADTESLLHPEDRRLASSQSSRESGEAALETEYRIHRADTGELRWIRRRAEFLKDGQGQPTFMVGVVQDLTERKLADALLRDSEARFRVLAQAMPNQVWTALPNGELDWFNAKALEYLGVGHEAMQGEQWMRALHPDDVGVVGPIWQQAIETGQPYETEFRVRRHDGSYRWHQARAVAVEDDRGISRWIGTNTDVDDYKMVLGNLARLNRSLEQQIKERVRDRDSIWRLSSDLMVTGDFGGRIEAFNPAWTKILGWSEDELTGRSLLDFLHADSRTTTGDELKQLISGKVVRNFENFYRHKDGSRRLISWNAVTEEGRIVAVGRDITEERERVEALRLSEEQLRQSQKMESIGQLTGGIAHDFNNLLTGIMGSLDMMRRRLDAGRTDDIERFMAAATTSAQRAASLTHRLLAFSRRQSLDLKPLDANQLVLSMEELLRRTLGEQIDLEVKIDAAGSPVSTDQNQLENALLNLAINARDAMPDGGKLTIEINTIALESRYTNQFDGVDPGHYIAISVSDTGTGMSAEVIAKVFEPFFTTKPIGHGTGLGLSMVYGFVRQSGGHVRVYSELGQGSTIKLYLPRLMQGPGATPETEARLLPRGTGEVVLVVEDDPAVRLLVLEVLCELGYTTLAAADASKALPILESTQSLDLMISDVGLPGMSGRQLADVARVHRPTLPILFITGYAEKAAVRSEFLAPGMQMISKPFSMDVLAVRISEIIGVGAPR